MINDDHLTAIATRIARHVAATTSHKPTIAEILQDLQTLDDFSPLPCAALLALDDQKLAVNICAMGIVGMLLYDIELGARLQ